MNQEHIKRKLSGILSADVVGYSRLIRENEASTVRHLEENKKLTFKIIEEYEGRVVDAPGDNILAEFSSVVKAVDCAVKIQKELKIKNAELVENRRMEFRIGINLGDVIEEDSRIYGDGVNIAARIEGLAQPGGICISRNVYDQVKAKLDLGYEYLGEHNVKNIDEPVRVYRVLTGFETAGKVIGEKKAPGMVSRRMAMTAIIILIIIAAGLTGWIIHSYQSRKIEPASIEPGQVPEVVNVVEAPKIIAILPFVNRSSEKDQEYFVDGLSDEIITRLSQISDLKVTSSTSSFTFKGSDKTIQEIAEILGVTYILEGSVRKVENALRINAQLIRAADDYHLWSEAYDRELKDIFEVQEDIANAVADELKLTLGIGKSYKQFGGTDNEKAYELYLIAKGQYSNSIANWSYALESLDSATALDPEFALAWASKSIIHTLCTVGLPSDSIETVQKMGLLEAQKAVELAPDMAAGYYALGYAKGSGGDFIGAELAYRNALELTDEPLSFIVPVVPIHYIGMGYFERANELLEEMLITDPLNDASRAFYIWNLVLLGDTQRALKEGEHARELLGFNYSYDISTIHLMAGDVVTRDQIECSDPIYDVAKEHLETPEEAIADLRRIYADKKNLIVADIMKIVLWSVYFADLEFAIEAMEEINRINPNGISFFYFLPSMMEIRQMPRFKELVKEVGLVDYWNKFGWPDICHKLDNGDFECD